MLVCARPWEVYVAFVFSSENRIFQTFLTKNLHFALFICQYGFFFVPLRAFYGVLALHLDKHSQNIEYYI